MAHLKHILTHFHLLCVYQFTIIYHYCMNFSSVPQGGLRKYCIDSQNWRRAVIIIAPVSLCQAHAQLQVSASMSLHVQGEMVRSRELSAAQVALEWLLTCNNKHWSICRGR